MHGSTAPSKLPLQDLIGQEVVQVCLGLGQVQLHFYRPPKEQLGRWEPGTRIDLEAGFEIHLPGQAASRVLQAAFKNESGALACLLGEQILQLQRMPRNELQLWFACGVCLQLLTDPQGFESYHLHASGKSVTVMQHSEA